jgi:hypothetical protein
MSTCRQIPAVTLTYVADYLCREKHRELIRSVYNIHDTTSVAGKANQANVVTTMKSVYPRALEFAESRQRRFEREARLHRGEIGVKLAAVERQRDLSRESDLLLECAELCDLAIYGAKTTQAFEANRDMETEVVRAGLTGDPALARSRMAAWKAAKKTAVQIEWDGAGKPRLVYNTPGRAVQVTGRSGKGTGGGHGNGPGVSSGSKKRRRGGTKTCHNCGKAGHFARDCTRKGSSPGSYFDTKKKNGTFHE